MMLESITVKAKEPAQYAMIWLHGLGADGHDFAPIAEQLQTQIPTPMNFIFPHARLRPVTFNGGYVMRAWYDIHGLDLASREDKDGLEETMQSVSLLIQQQVDEGIPAKNIFLGGFSQGGATALYCGLHYPQPLAGIIAFSAYLPLRHQLKASANAVNQMTPILLAHGTEDLVVPLAWGELSCQVLKAHDYAVTWQTYPMAHQVSPVQLGDMVNWLKQKSFSV